VNSENQQTASIAKLPAPHQGPAEAISIWQKLVAKSRIDLSNIEELTEWGHLMLGRGEKWLVIDLKGTRFMSLPVIRYLEDLSEELRRAGGALAFEAMPDKTRRIFEIYGSLQYIVVVSRSEQLRSAREKLSHPIFFLSPNR
jgi:anti-anti-sigma regulatory factor